MIKLNHLMVDLETLGNKAGCAIASIAAVQFDLATGEIGRQFSLGVDLKSCEGIGLRIQADVVEWWMTQPEDARNYFVERKRYDISLVLQKLAEHFPVMCDMQVWGNGPKFDFGILEAAYEAAGLPRPWNHRNERCVRTLLSLRPDVKSQVPFEGTKHDPLSDCMHQIGYCHRAYTELAGQMNQTY